MLDITPLFKACVKTQQTRNKALGLSDRDKLSGIARPTKPKSQFSVKVKDLISTITKMREFLLEHRKDYINANHFLCGASNMTDSERDRIDSDAQAFIQMCMDFIKNLNNEVQKHSDSQNRQHQEALINLVDDYLKAVCKIYSGQKAIRVKRAFDKQKMLRLGNDVRHGKSLPNLEESLKENEKPFPKETTASFRDETDWETSDINFSPEEVQMFEEENHRLYEEMNTLVDEISEIEGRVVEIGRLQEILSEKVLQQDQDINRISDMVIGTTENIKEGNEDVREAMRKKAGFRIWILFFILVLSFSLLFLDWYSP